MNTKTIVSIVAYAHGQQTFTEARRAVNPQSRAADWYYYSRNTGVRAARAPSCMAWAVWRVARLLGYQGESPSNWPVATWVTKWPRTVKAYAAESAGDTLASECVEYIAAHTTIPVGRDFHIVC